MNDELSKLMFLSVLNLHICISSQLAMYTMGYIGGFNLQILLLGRSSNSFKTNRYSSMDFIFFWIDLTFRNGSALHEDVKQYKLRYSLIILGKFWFESLWDFWSKFF